MHYVIVDLKLYAIKQLVFECLGLIEGSFSKEANKLCAKPANFSSIRKMNDMKIPSPIKNECAVYPTLWPGCSPYSQANDSTFPSSEQDMSSSFTISSKSSTGENFQRHKKWITEEILEMIAIRDKLYKRMKKQPSPDIIHMYKKVSDLRTQKSFR